MYRVPSRLLNSAFRRDVHLHIQLTVAPVGRPKLSDRHSIKKPFPAKSFAQRNFGFDAQICSLHFPLRCNLFTAGNYHWVFLPIESALQHV
jgi:hypothetical protein